MPLGRRVAMVAVNPRVAKLLLLVGHLATCFPALSKRPLQSLAQACPLRSRGFAVWMVIILRGRVGSAADFVVAGFEARSFVAGRSARAGWGVGR